MNVVNGVSRSHKTANIFLHLTHFAFAFVNLIECIYRFTRCHCKAIHLIIIPIIENSLVTYLGHGTHSTVETRWLSG